MTLRTPSLQHSAVDCVFYQLFFSVPRYFTHFRLRSLALLYTWATSRWNTDYNVLYSHVVTTNQTQHWGCTGTTSLAVFSFLFDSAFRLNAGCALSYQRVCPNSKDFCNTHYHFKISVRPEVLLTTEWKNHRTYPDQCTCPYQFGPRSTTPGAACLLF